MPQQINLLAPILLAPKRYFSALTLVQATGVLVAAGLLLALWLQRADARAAAQHEQLLAQLAVEKQSLLAAQAGLPQAANPAAVEQQLQAIQSGNAERVLLLQALGAGTTEGRRHSDLLALVARTQPPPVWLSELRWNGGRLELSGGTLDTAVLRPWLSQLAAHPLLQGQELQGLRVERINAKLSTDANASALLTSTQADALRDSPLPLWAFRVVSAPSAAVASAAASAPATSATQASAR